MESENSEMGHDGFTMGARRYHDGDATHKELFLHDFYYVAYGQSNSRLMQYQGNKGHVNAGCARMS